jgi:hypothetical protein
VSVLGDATGERVGSGLGVSGWEVGSGIFRAFFLGGSRSKEGATGVLAAGGFVFLYSAKSDEAFSLSASTDFRDITDFFGIDNSGFLAAAIAAAGLVPFSNFFIVTSIFCFACFCFNLPSSLETGSSFSCTLLFSSFGSILTGSSSSSSFGSSSMASILFSSSSSSLSAILLLVRNRFNRTLTSSSSSLSLSSLMITLTLRGFSVDGTIAEVQDPIGISADASSLTLTLSLTRSTFCCASSTTSCSSTAACSSRYFNCCRAVSRLRSMVYGRDDDLLYLLLLDPIRWQQQTRQYKAASSRERLKTPNQ